MDPGGGGLGWGSEGPEQRVGDPDGDGDAGARERRERVGGGGGEADARDGVGKEQALHDPRRRERVRGRETPVHPHRGGRRWRRHSEEQEEEEARYERRQRAAGIGRHCLPFRVALQDHRVLSIAADVGGWEVTSRSRVLFFTGDKFVSKSQVINAYEMQEYEIPGRGSGAFLSCNWNWLFAWATDLEFFWKEIVDFFLKKYQ